MATLITDLYHRDEQTGTSGSHCLDVQALHVHYGPVCALRDVSFQTHCGKAVGLIGGNGAGKSTLMKAIVGLTPFSSGNVLWRNTPVDRSTHEIAYLPQREQVDWDFPITVRGLVEMGRFPLLGMLTPFKTRDSQAVDEALETMRIENLQKRQISQLSGGQQQRVFIARALAQEAHVLLLDEPFTGLDQPSRETLSNLLKELVKHGRLIIASHHDLQTVEDLFDEVILLNHTLIDFGVPENVLTEQNMSKAF